MILWLSLCIPIFAGIFLFIQFPKKVTWWETSLPTIVGLIIIFLIKLIYENGVTIDTEYRGQLVTQSKYYEYWSTWVDKTCSRQSCSGSGKNRICHTVYYDCSYCDENAAHWLVEDNSGRTISVSQDKWDELRTRWNAKPEFVNENRSIKKHWGCGQDGNSFKIHWDNKIETSEASVSTQSYTNKILGSKNAFSYKEVTDAEKKQYGLYEYPERYEIYKQPAILGLDQLPIENKVLIKRQFEYMNGLGSKHHGKIFILLYPNKEIDASFKQEALWVGGKRNELVVCVGYNTKTLKMDWVRAFSWDKNKRCIVESREGMMEIGNVVEWNKIYDTMYNTMTKYHQPRNFHDFDYLTIEIPTWLLIIIYIAVGISTVLLSRWAVINEFHNED